MTVVRLVLAAVTAPSEEVGPVAAHLATPPVAVEALTMSAGRLGSTVAALMGLAGVVIGALALARPTGRAGIGGARLGVIAAVAGAAGMLLGGLVVATSDSGIGTGNGRGGGYVALVVGLIAVLVGGLTMVRSRRAG